MTAPWRLPLVLASCLLVAGALAPALVSAEAAKPPEEPADAFIGIYAGQYAPAAGGAGPAAEASVVLESGGTYRAAITFTPSGAGAKPVRLELTGKLDEKKVPLSGKAGEVEWKGTVTDGKLAAESKDGKFDLKLTVKKPPTLGARPPAGAVVLIPFEEGKPPAMDAWTNPEWIPMTDGSVLAAKGDTRTRRPFGDMQLHVEFRIPVEPEGKGQDRGNSGLYILDLYEVQILDSFGLVPTAGDCGAVYRQTAPKASACLPPGQWQTFDMTFRAPRFDADGKKVKDAVISILQNGLEIHKDQAISGPTGAAKGRPEVKAAPMRLQEHKHPVRFRNVWVVELKD